MSTTVESPNASSLYCVQRAFEHWRQSRIRRGFTPRELRIQAVSLIAEHRRVHICTALHISDKALKKWSLELDAQNNVASYQTHESYCEGAFVELPAHRAPLCDGTPSQPFRGLSIELADGAVIHIGQEYTLEQVLSAARTSPEQGV